MSNENGDAQLTVGANIAPFQQKMAQVRAAAMSTGKTIGVELGDRKGAREEMRMQRGLDQFLKSLANAKDPISAVTGGVEGLGRAFLITGPLMLAAGAFGFIYEQVQKVRDITRSMDDGFASLNGIDVDKVGVNELEKGLEKADGLLAKAKEDHGYLYNFLYGSDDGPVQKAQAEVDKFAAALDALKAHDMDAQTNIKNLRANGDDTAANIAEENESYRKDKEDFQKGITKKTVVVPAGPAAPWDTVNKRHQQVLLPHQQKQHVDSRHHLVTDPDPVSPGPTTKEVEDDSAVKKQLEALERDHQQKLDDIHLKAFLKGNELDGKAAEASRKRQAEVDAKNQKQTQSKNKKNLKSFQDGNELDAERSVLFGDKRRAEANVAGAGMLEEHDVSSLRRVGLAGAEGIGAKKDNKPLDDANKTLEKILDALKAQHGTMKGVTST